MMIESRTLFVQIERLGFEIADALGVEVGSARQLSVRCRSALAGRRAQQRQAASDFRHGAANAVPPSASRETVAEPGVSAWDRRASRAATRSP